VLRASEGPRLPAPGGDEGATFLRARVTGFALWTGLFMTVFGVANAFLAEPREGLHALGLAFARRDPSLLVGPFLIVVSRLADRLSLSRPMIRALDAALSVVASAGVDTSLLARPVTDHLELSLTLAAMTALLIRAAIVPSSGRWTALVGALATAPLVVTTHAAYAAVASADDVWRITVGVMEWSAIAVAASALVSRRLYAMERRIHAAERYGQYALEAKIGEGGMGEVFRARHALLQRPTALKLLPRARAGVEAIARFEREVQMTSRLTHPSTIQIYDFGRAEDGTFYYAMELIDGVTLDELVTESGAQPAGRVARILADVCGSLAEAHAAGLVHRDVKPQNVMLCARGGAWDVVKVLDFGLVKVVSERDASAGRAVAGTPAYMAPEALQHPDRLGPASDLYAVGALGYFLLTGAPVFAGETAFELFGQHLHAAPVSPSERAGRPIPAALERIVLACLAKSPDARPASANALRALLDETGLAADWKDETAAAWWSARGAAPSSRARVEAGRIDHGPRALRVTRG
jgi:hypothetical protein